MNFETILNKPFKLSDEQTEIILAKDKYIKVEAAAGTGKTETIARKIISLLLDRKIKAKNIVAFTFTEKAANEMKARIYEIANSIGDDLLINNLNDMYIGTIHAYCKRILEDKFSYDNYTLFDENKEIAFLLKIGFDLNLQEYDKNYTRSIIAFHRTVDMIYNELIDYNKLKLKSPKFYKVLKKYEDKLEEYKILTFGKIIHDTIIKLKENYNVIKDLDISYLFVDEFQDINPSQYELIKLLISNNSGLFIVGDPRQTIYQWRGSDHSLFGKIENDLPGIKVFYLNSNMRSTKNLVSNANYFSKKLEGNYKDMIPTREENYPLIIKSFNTDIDEANWIANTVINLVKDSKLNYKDVGVLLRSVKNNGKDIINVFKEKKIPYQIAGTSGLFQRDEIKIISDIFSWLKIELNDENKTNLSLNSIISNAKSVFHLDDENYTKSVLLNILKNIDGYENITDLFQDILNALYFINFDPNNDEDAIIMANMGKFSVLLTDFETAWRIGGHNFQWKSIIKYLEFYMNMFAKNFYEEAQLDVDETLNAVTITTIHQAKGLEWAFVIVAQVNEKIFPSSNVGKKLNWCGISNDLFNASRYEGSEDDEKRLFYVAITRAKDILAITHISKKESRFLDYIDKNLFGEYNFKNFHFEYKNENNIVSKELTPSEIIWYHRCPYMYRLRKVWGFQPGLREEIGFGNAMHSVLRNAVKLIKSESIGQRSAIKESNDRYFNLPFVNRKKLEFYKEKSLEILDSFVIKNPEFLLNANEVEYRINYKKGKIIIVGRADMIGTEKNEKYVADYKTNRDVNTFEEIEIQIGLYLIGLKTKNENIKKGKIVYLQENEIEELEMNEDKILSINKKIDEIIDGIDAKKYNPKLGDNCENCDLKKICKYGGKYGKR